MHDLLQAARSGSGQCPLDPATGSEISGGPGLAVELRERTRDETVDYAMVPIMDCIPKEVSFGC